MNADETNFATLLQSPPSFQYTAHTASATPQHVVNYDSVPQQPPLLQVPSHNSQPNDTFQPSPALSLVLDNWLQKKVKEYVEALNAKQRKEEHYKKITNHIAQETLPQDLRFKYKAWATAPMSIPAHLIKETQEKEQTIIAKAKFDILLVREPLLKADLQEAINKLNKFSNKKEMQQDLANVSSTLKDHPQLLQRTVDSFFIMRDTTNHSRSTTTQRTRADTDDATTPMATDAPDPLATLTELVASMKTDMDELRKELRSKNATGRGDRPPTPASNNQTRGRSKTRQETRHANRSPSRSFRQSSRSPRRHQYRSNSTQRSSAGQRKNGSKTRRNTEPNVQNNQPRTTLNHNGRHNHYNRGGDDARGRANQAPQRNGQQTQREKSKTRYKNYK